MYRKKALYSKTDIKVCLRHQLVLKLGLVFSVSTTGMLAGIKMSHAAVTSLCRSMKLACELYPSRHIALCLDPYCGLGFALWCLSR
jgi:hypothetical protein